MPVPVHSTEHLPAQPVIRHIPLPEQLALHPPPAHLRVAVPLPVCSSVQLPAVQVNVEEPLPLARNAQPGPLHVREQALEPVHRVHGLSFTHAAGFRFFASAEPRPAPSATASNASSPSKERIFRARVMTPTIQQARCQLR